MSTSHFQETNRITVVPGFPSQPLTDLRSIVESPLLEATYPKTGEPLTLPFVNKRYRAQVRVLDFKPNNLEDFAHYLDDPKYILNADPNRPSNRWEWQFYLLIGDANPSPGQSPIIMKLIVQEKYAEFLLNLTACE
jgi:hypothetical protein